MLILTRKVGESITVGDNVRVLVLEIEGQQVRVGIEAPRKVPVYRGEAPRVTDLEPPANLIVPPPKPAAPPHPPA